MSLPVWTKEIIHPILNKPINEYNITCPLHYFSYIRFKEVLTENGYVFISSEDIYLNRDCMEFVYIDLSGSKQNYLLEVYTTLSFDEFETLYKKAIVQEFKNKYILVDGLSCNVQDKFICEDFDNIIDTIPPDVVSLLEKSLWNYEEICNRYSSHSIANTLGMLIYGAPGVGKTYALRSYLNKLITQRNFTVVQIYQDCLDNTNMSVLLRNCNMLFPCILFIEDIDIKYKDRVDNTSSLAGDLLETFDGLSRVENVILIATSNHYDSIEKALLRPGRIDYMIEVEKPSNKIKSNALNKYIDNVEFEVTEDLKEYLIQNSDSLAELNGAFQHIVRSYITEGFIPDTAEIGDTLSKWKDTMYRSSFDSNNRKVGLV